MCFAFALPGSKREDAQKGLKFRDYLGIHRQGYCYHDLNRSFWKDVTSIPPKKNKNCNILPFFPHQIITRKDSSMCFLISFKKWELIWTPFFLFLKHSRLQNYPKCFHWKFKVWLIYICETQAYTLLKKKIHFTFYCCFRFAEIRVPILPSHPPSVPPLINISHL